MTNWQNVLLSEWRNTKDEDYAYNLFGLVANESTGNISKSITTFLGISCGVLFGLALPFLLSTEFSLEKYLFFVGLGGIVGGLFSATKQDLSWHKFFTLFTPEVSHKTLNRLNNFVAICLFLIIVGLLVGLSVNLLSVGLTYALGKILPRNPFQEPGLLSLVGILFLVIGPASGLWLGNFVFKTGGWIVGVVSGFAFVIGTRNFLSLEIQPLPIFMELSKTTFLIGLSATGILFLDPRLSNANDGLDRVNHKHMFRYRSWWTWWQHKLDYLELENAIQKAIIGKPQSQQWTDLLWDLEEEKTQKETIEALIHSFETRDWEERFIARQVLRKISQDTQALNNNSPSRLFCTDCFVEIYPHKISLPSDSIYTIYACRKCRQYERFLSVEAVVAVLDKDLHQIYIKNNGLLQVNWLKHRYSFDFDFVEIASTTDEDVERFVVQVGNDTDVFRQSRYKQIDCTIVDKAKLSENSVKILQKTFNRVSE